MMLTAWVAVDSCSSPADGPYRLNTPRLIRPTLPPPPCCCPAGLRRRLHGAAARGEAPDAARGGASARGLLPACLPVSLLPLLCACKAAGLVVHLQARRLCRHEDLSAACPAHLFGPADPCASSQVWRKVPGDVLQVSALLGGGVCRAAGALPGHGGWQVAACCLASCWSEPTTVWTLAAVPPVQTARHALHLPRPSPAPALAPPCLASSHPALPAPWPALRCCAAGEGPSEGDARAAHAVQRGKVQEGHATHSQGGWERGWGGDWEGGQAGGRVGGSSKRSSQ